MKTLLSEKCPLILLFLLLEWEHKESILQQVTNYAKDILSGPIDNHIPILLQSEAGVSFPEMLHTARAAVWMQVGVRSGRVHSSTALSPQAESPIILIILLGTDKNVVIALKIK